MDNKLDVKQAQRVATASHRELVFGAIKKAAQDGAIGIKLFLTPREYDELNRLKYKLKQLDTDTYFIEWGMIE